MGRARHGDCIRGVEGRNMIWQKTLAQPLNFSGIGLHSGKQVDVTLYPAVGQSRLALCPDRPAEPAADPGALFQGGGHHPGHLFGGERRHPGHGGAPAGGPGGAGGGQCPDRGARPGAAHHGWQRRSLCPAHRQGRPAVPGLAPGLPHGAGDRGIAPGGAVDPGPARRAPHHLHHRLRPSPHPAAALHRAAPGRELL